MVAEVVEGDDADIFLARCPLFTSIPWSLKYFSNVFPSFGAFLRDKLSASTHAAIFDGNLGDSPRYPTSCINSAGVTPMGCCAPIIYACTVVSLVLLSVDTNISSR